MDLSITMNQLHMYLKRHRPQIMPPDHKTGLYEIVETYIPPKKGINIFAEDDTLIENPTYKDVLTYMINKQKPGHKDLHALVSKIDDLVHQTNINPDFRPEKSSVLKAIIHLGLNEIDATYLLSASNYNLKTDDTKDLIIRFCIEKNIYDLEIVNALLEKYDLETL